MSIVTSMVKGLSFTPATKCDWCGIENAGQLPPFREIEAKGQRLHVCKACEDHAILNLLQATPPRK